MVLTEKWILPAVLLLLLGCLLGGISVGRVAASDVDVLLNLKYNLHDPSGVLANWTEYPETPLCEWKGIACAKGSTDSVENISLRGYYLGGLLSSAIGYLPELKHVDLSYNMLNGSIPWEINLLKNLTSLNLQRNWFTGNIPGNWSNLTHLETLNLRDNYLNDSIPSGLSAAVALQWLFLENNSLSGEIPREIGLLKGLKYLAVENNELTGQIPREIVNLTGLVSIYAAHNRLNGTIPDGIGNLTKLVHFEVEGNELSGSIPASLGNLSSLTTLNLSDNNFIGTVPPTFSKFAASSFLNNPKLCGSPLANCSSPPPPPYDKDGREPPSERSPSPRSSPMTPPYDGYPSSKTKSSSKSSQTGKIIGGVVGGVVGASALIILLLVFVRSRRRKEGVQVQNWFSPDIQADRRKGKFQMFATGFKYNYEEIVSHGGYFDTAHVVGKGRSATVYRSAFPDGTQLAVKVFKFVGVAATFEKEIETLATIRHRHLLPILGYYSNPVEKAIFYEFLPKGTLYDLLHKKDQDSVELPDWATRQRIAMGVAQAMAYLHRGCTYRILHKDLKSSNILLSADLSPRVSDFGQAQLIFSKPQDTAVIVETPGYTAPELSSTKKYTEKSDVYSFGVVLLELITGKKPVSYIGERAVNLTKWVTRLHKEGRGREVLDPVAAKTCPFPDYLDKALNLAVLCLSENPLHRPTMSEVAAILEGLAANPSPLRSPEMRIDKPLLH